MSVWKPRAKLWFRNTMFENNWCCQCNENLLMLKSPGICQSEAGTDRTFYSTATSSLRQELRHTNRTVTSTSLQIHLLKIMTILYVDVCTIHSGSLRGVSTFPMKIRTISFLKAKEDFQDHNAKCHPGSGHSVGGDVEGNFLAFRGTKVSWDLSLDTDPCISCEQ